MSALEELSVPRPRPEALAKRYARRMDPWWGFVLAGVIWTICGFAMTMVLMLKITERLGLEAGSHGAQAAAIIGLLGGGAAIFFTFRWWRRSRLADKALLVRDGELIEVAVTGKPLRLTSTKTTVDLEGGKRRLRCVFNRWFSPSTGDTFKLLHHRGVAHVVAFDRGGDMYSGSPPRVATRNPELTAESHIRDDGGRRATMRLNLAEPLLARAARPLLFSAA